MKPKSKSQLEQTINGYWEVSTAIRHPKAKPFAAQDTIRILNKHKDLPYTAKTQRTIKHMSALLDDVIEGMPPRKHYQAKPSSGVVTFKQV